MADSSATSPIKSVRVDALVALKVIKHATNAFPSIITGQLLGMEVDGVLQITNSFPFPTSNTDPSIGDDGEKTSAAGAPRAKSSQWYQNEMLKYLREVNVDANSVGWYISANMGNFVNTQFIENQYHFQNQMNERTVALVYDSARSGQGGTALKAYRLSPSFMAAFKDGKFSSESLVKFNLTYKDVLQELPLTLYNSHLVNSFLHQLSVPQTQSSLPNSLSSLLNPPTSASPSYPLYPNFNSFDLTIDPLLERSCDLLLESIEAHNTEVNNASFHQRQLAREQAKITAWQQKRKSENALRTAAKQPLLPEDEYLRLFKMPQEPSRLETLLNSRQVEQYARQVDGLAATTSAKLFAVNGGLPKF